MRKIRYESMGERLIANSAIIENQCWQWLCACNSTNGYGRISVRVNGIHKKLLAHRVSFETFIRKLRRHEEIDHRCYNPACINPEHLSAVYHKTNCNRRR